MQPLDMASSFGPTASSLKSHIYLVYIQTLKEDTIFTYKKTEVNYTLESQCSETASQIFTKASLRHFQICLYKITT